MSASGSADQPGNDVSRMPPRIISLAIIAMSLQKKSRSKDRQDSAELLEQQSFDLRVST
jgi:hypothetical protein